jgi:hypothetical protein
MYAFTVACVGMDVQMFDVSWQAARRTQQGEASSQVSG